MLIGTKNLQATTATDMATARSKLFSGNIKNTAAKGATCLFGFAHNPSSSKSCLRYKYYKVNAFIR
jgi:hypothetical protein